MLRRDLEAVGIPYQDDAGRFADFHSLRHTFASVLDKAELTLKERQTLLRHSTIALTMDVYTHIGLFDARQGVDKMPVLPSITGDDKKKGRAAMPKTGTDDSPVTADKGAYKPAYKKLAKTAYSGCTVLSATDTAQATGAGGFNKHNNGSKSRNTADLGSDKTEMSANVIGRKTEWAGVESNHRHTDFQSVALPTELPARNLFDINRLASVLSSAHVAKNNQKIVRRCQCS